MLNIVIGYDKNEAVAFHVLAHSIMRHASCPVAITPLYRPMLEAKHFYTRPRTHLESTEFSLTRFLTPAITPFGGTSIFMDCDMLVRGDVAELLAASRESPYADVLVVKHHYKPSTGTKFLGQPQTDYPCKNWSSVMAFNGWRTRVQELTPTAVSCMKPSDLHQFKWADSVANLPTAWNHLVGEYAPNPDAKLVHWTLGGPWFKGYENTEFAEEWRNEYTLMTGGQSFLL